MTRWVLNDENVAYPMFKVITDHSQQLKTHPGFFNICIHKGLSTAAPDDPSSEPLGFPTDIPKAAYDWPMLNFIIYHSCIRPGFWVRNALLDLASGRTREVHDGGPRVPDILWTTRF